MTSSVSSARPSMWARCSSRATSSSWSTVSATTASSSSGVRPATLARKMSPVEIAGTPKWVATTLAWVPLPAPGGPMRIRRTPPPPRRDRRQADRPASTEEPLVIALLQLALDLLHGVEGDADHDQQRGAAEGEVLVRADERQRDERDQRDQAEVGRPGERDPGQHVVEVLL